MQLQAALGRLGTFPNFEEFRLLPVSWKSDSWRQVLNIQGFKIFFPFLFFSISSTLRNMLILLVCSLITILQFILAAKRLSYG
jgi:hypothetical protein